ncbi:MAG: hypothetical protein HRU19_05840 [Pseudobacteriovorax sp.]|nr:hypothetical protein [Pseudobacteriovorax sp.]
MSFKILKNRFVQKLFLLMPLVFVSHVCGASERGLNELSLHQQDHSFANDEVFDVEIDADTESMDDAELESFTKLHKKWSQKHIVNKPLDCVTIKVDGKQKDRSCQ